MIAFQIIGGLVTGALLVALLYERITTGTLVDSDGSEIPPRHQVNMILLVLVELDTAPAPEAGKALDLVLRLHREGTLSEGQVSTALGIDRVAVRVLADAVTMCGLCGCAMCGCGRRYDP